jgi:hypothetical protein
MIFERQEESADAKCEEAISICEDRCETGFGPSNGLSDGQHEETHGKSEAHHLYRVSGDSIESLDTVCHGWRELQKTYLERAKIANEVLLECHDGKVRRIETRGGMILHGQVEKWEPCDESQECGKRVLIIEEGCIEGRMAMPPSQMVVPMSMIFRDAVAELVDSDDSGHPYFRFFPANVDCSMADKHWRLAMEFPRESLPCIVIMNSCTWRSFPLPMTVEEAIELVREYLG